MKNNAIMKNSSLFICFLNLCFLFFYQTTNAQNIENATDSSKVVCYTYPRISPKSVEYKVRVNNKEVFVYNTSAGPFAAFACDGPVQIEVEMPGTTKTVTVNPLKYGIKTTLNNNRICFSLPKAMSVVVEVDGMPQLFIYANSIESNKPSISDSNVKYFKAGQVYEVGDLQLKSNETLYIEGGAVVRGRIRATSAQNVKITGSGILDGGFYYESKDERRSIVFEDCQNSVIENIIMIEPSSWMIVLGLCENITVRNVKELGSVISTDGADIIGSKHIRIENCIFRNGDDCIAIKSLYINKKDATMDYSKDVEDVEINSCVFLAYRGGTALEIGHELRTASIKNIRFINCDVLGVHGFGGIFGIHNADRATVSDVLYENIRVEHHYNKLIDLKIIKSMYGRDMERGQVRDVVFKNIDVTISKYNPGYSMSLIGGFDAKHTIQNVTFDNFKLNGVKVLNGDQMDLFLKEAFNVKFK